MKLLGKINDFLSKINYIMNSTDNTARYRVIKIYQDKNLEYRVVLQVVNTNKIFKYKPEEILADDMFVDCLSPRDVRNLTYLGYLSINQPKFKILAQQFIDNSSIFIVQKKGDKKPIVKTAKELSQEAETISKFDPIDAKTIGYAAASSEFHEEIAGIDELKKTLLNKK